MNHIHKLTLLFLSSILLFSCSNTYEPRIHYQHKIVLIESTLDRLNKTDDLSKKKWDVLESEMHMVVTFIYELKETDQAYKNTKLLVPLLRRGEYEVVSDVLYALRIMGPDARDAVSDLVKLYLVAMEADKEVRSTFRTGGPGRLEEIYRTLKSIDPEWYMMPNVSTEVTDHVKKNMFFYGE